MWIDDQILKRCRETMVCHCWVPSGLTVVLGASNQPDVEVNIDECHKDDVPILKRYGGGGTVVLHSGCVVISLGCWVSQHYQNKLYFEMINKAVISALAVKWPMLGAMGQNGLSDLTYGDNKVAGTSLFRSRNYLLYQASILVDAQVNLIGKYLRHPSREPEYRKGRTHGAFLLGLSEVEPQINSDDCLVQLQQLLPGQLQAVMGSQLIDSRPEQWAGLLSRAGL